MRAFFFCRLLKVSAGVAIRNARRLSRIAWYCNLGKVHGARARVMSATHLEIFKKNEGNSSGWKQHAIKNQKSKNIQRRKASTVRAPSCTLYHLITDSMFQTHLPRIVV